jgi:hypothetical protein
VLPPIPASVVTNARAFRVLVRNEMFRRVQLAARDDAVALGELDAAAGFDEQAWGEALDRYFDEHDSMSIAGDARGPAMIAITEMPGQWQVRQIIADPAGNHDWSISATVDLVESAAEGVAVVRVFGFDRLD